MSSSPSNQCNTHTHTHTHGQTIQIIMDHIVYHNYLHTRVCVLCVCALPLLPQHTTAQDTKLVVLDNKESASHLQYHDTNTRIRTNTNINNANNAQRLVLHYGWNKAGQAIPTTGYSYLITTVQARVCVCL